MNHRAAHALAPALATVAVVAATRQVLHGACLLAAAAFAIGLGPMFRVGHNAQRLTFVIAGTLGGALGVLLVPASPSAPTLAGGWCIAASALCLAGLVRATFEHPEGGTRAGFALVVAALLLAGQVHSRRFYLPVAGLSLAVAIVGMRSSDRGRLPIRALAPRTLAMGAALVACVAAFTVGMGRALPWVHARIMVKFLQSFGESAESGLEDSLRLGALTSLMQSEELVLRVHGRGVDRVRGAAYDRYDRGRWISSHGPAHAITRVGRGPMRQRDAVMVERLGGVRGWVMIPLEAAALATEEGTVRVDPLGVVRSIPGDPATRAWFRPGARGVAAPRPPGPTDLAIPEPIRPRLTQLAAQYGAGGATPFERVEHIAEVLGRRYRYSLRFQRTPGRDAVMDFLDRHPQGHCEYFASALALLGRAAGVPTRVVGGYRVAERNPVGDYFVVREKNAHAWVEAWDPSRGWVTLDATPANELPQNRPHESRWTAALGDGVAVLAARVRDWFGARTSEQLLGVALVLLVGWLGWRTWRGRSEAGAVVARAADDAPLPCWTALSSALSSRGIVRSPNETLEAYAARVSSTDLLAADLRARAADAIRAYAAVRYGSPADAGAVVRQANDVARALG